MTIDPKSLTADSVLTMPVADMEPTYRALRSWLEAEFDALGYEARCLAREGAHGSPGFSGERLAHANGQRSQLLTRRETYDRLADVKHLLAILTGRYDDRLPTDETRAPAVRRRAEIVAARRSRPVYAVRLDAATGAVREGFERLEGTAASRDEAVAVARAEGHTVVIDGGLVERTPGEVLGEETDVWTVTVEAA